MARRGRACHSASSAPLPLSSSREACAVLPSRSGISERAIFRFLQRDDFRAELALLHRQTFAGVLARSEFLASKALGVLEEVLDDPETSHRDRIAAAREVLALAHRAFEGK